MPKRDAEYMASRRRQIMDAATSCFLRMGYEATSIADIRQESGLSTGAIYLHFKDKASLLRAIAEDRKKAIAAEMSAATTPETGSWARRRLSALENQEVLRGIAVDLEILARPAGEDGAAEAVGSAMRLERETLKAANHCSTDYPEPAATVLQAFLLGAGVLTLAKGAPLSELEAALEFLLPRLRSEPMSGATDFHEDDKR